MTMIVLRCVAIPNTVMMTIAAIVFGTTPSVEVIMAARPAFCASRIVEVIVA